MNCRTHCADSPAHSGLVPTVTHRTNGLTVTEWHSPPPAHANPFPQPEAITRGTPMTATHWLIIAIVITLICVLAGLWATSRVRTAAQDATYRTASGAQMARDVRALQQQVPAAPRPRHRAGQPAVQTTAQQKTAT